jgi:hypothetical protein
MTTASICLPDRGGSQPVTLHRVIASERVKFFTLRSTVSVLTVTLFAMVIVGAIVGWNTRHLSPVLQANDIVASAPLQGYFLGQLLIGVLGVLFVTGEYATGQIRSTLVAVPRRLPVFWGKLTVFTAATLLPLIVVSVAAFAVAEAIIGRYRVGLSLSDPGAARVVIGTGIYLTLIGILGMAIGWIVRSTPGAIVTYIGVVLVLPGIFGNVLGHWGKVVSEVLPSSAGAAFINTIPDGFALRPWPGLAVMVAWLAFFLAVAAILLRRRDA